MKTNTDKLKFVLCRYRNNMYLKYNESDLKLTEHQTLLTERVPFLRQIVVFWGCAWYWQKQFFRNKESFANDGYSFFWPFSEFTRDRKWRLNTIVIGKTYFYVPLELWQLCTWDVPKTTVWWSHWFLLRLWI